MLARDIMVTNLPLVEPSARMDEIAKTMLRHGISHVLVVDDAGKLLGLVSGHDLRRVVADNKMGAVAAEIMTPREKLLTARPDTPLEEAAAMLTERRLTQLPVVESDVPVGYLNLNEVLQHTAEAAKYARHMLDRFRQAAELIDAMREGVVVVDKDFRILEFNRAAELASGLAREKVLGKKSRVYMAFNSPVRKVMETGQPLYNVEVENGKQVFITNNVPIIQEGALEGVLQTFTEITETKQMHFQLLKARDELDKAFALTLPNSRVEYKLKSTPEYRDIYNRDTGLIEITEVIEDGGYHHVVNALKVAADLNEKGMMSLPGMDKDTLVQALIFHDLGKSQPVLNVGQVVDPKKVFEESRLHAWRSAEIAEKFYNKPPDVVTLIRYHHHCEADLPAGFPGYLLPMFRLLKIIDGLSAGLTRRSARVGFRVSGPRLTVLEHNCHPDFNRTVEVDLYTGQEFVYTEKKVTGRRREALQ